MKTKHVNKFKIHRLRVRRKLPNGKYSLVCSRCEIEIEYHKKGTCPR